MKQSEFKLPPEYQEIPQFFDAHNSDEDTARKNSVIELLLKKNGAQNVLDMTCGTGSQVFFLTKKGYKVTGSDFSPDLLNIARDKAKKAKLDIQFLDGDMRTLQLGKFDAVITIFNAIGHLTKSNFEKALRNINSNLKKGGIYIFDIFNLEAMTDAMVADLEMLTQKKVGNTQLHLSQFSTLDKQKGLLTSYNTYSMQKGVTKPKVFQSQFTLQIYTVEDLKNRLYDNGFEVIHIFGMDGEKFDPTKTQSILTVAKKISD